MNWDGLISMTILITLCLFVWSKFKQQTLRETIEGIKEQVENNG
tara:strand:+ start:1503 stop:1634 length:132 start_codon:yes stop_codon:yes gene_type:complete